MKLESAVPRELTTDSIENLTGGSIWDTWLDTDSLDQLVNHPLLLAMQEGSISLKGMRFFLVQHHHYSRNFTRFLCAIINRLESLDDIKHLMENMQEEMGIDGVGKVTHAELFQRTLRATGTHAMAEKALPQTLDFTQTVMDFCRCENSIEGLAALCMGAEAIVPLIYRPVLQALERLNVSEEGLEFFRVHIEEDEDHAITMLGILEQLVQCSPGARLLAKDVGRQVILKRCAMFDAIWQKVGQEPAQAHDEQRAQPDKLTWLNAVTTVPVQLPRRLLHVAVEGERGAPRATPISSPKSSVVDLPVQTMRMSLEQLAPSTQTRLHRHNYETVIYVLSGSGATYIEEKVLHWEAGDAIYVPAWAGHYHVSDHQQTVSYIACENSPLLASQGKIVIREEL
ncbi:MULTISPECIES: iron-containing redox enzyme family protein [Pseudomonas]|uniref:iron-containing redox enzyme family protein n=1 Tax=Pseudomonas TaxID=286 RepID=UPI002366B533|nr:MULTISPECIES: iron-containing redox enzyme family protein [Pseudomonas]WDG56808.1 iron-containing redox enzyme family protein [Pseudomonas chlororaphis]WDH52740.1 iron-containing redox enzyme family protein [Pseudomonas chlororaphis]WDH87987.1 iron-containing redox enzyme family protein [Pseudomonas chlororaphis]WPO46896.1 iron-containing redox enzyme family protein [Pseudomonas sp. S1Bt23]